MKSITRRKFVRQASTGATGLLASGPFLRSGRRVFSPNNTINVAVMGIRSRGRQLAKNFASLWNVRVAALCDVDERLLREVAAELENLTGERPRTDVDVRWILDNKDIDVLAIAAPNHWHALATIWACQAGKDVYVEKPASYNIFEGRKMVEAAEKYECIIQVGTQNRSRSVVRAAMDYLHAGKLGEIYMVKCLIFRPREGIGHRADGPIPPGVSYDLWLGPAPWRPFNENRFHYNWHWFWDTGNGETGNNGPHYTDMARWALQKYEHPVRIQSMGGNNVFDSDQETPNTQFSMMEYGDGTSVQLEVRGLYTNAEDGMQVGLLIYTSKGWMRLDSEGWATYFGRKNEPGEKMTDKVEPARRELPHFVNFIQCVRSRRREDLTADVLEGHLSATMCHLCNIAYRTRRQVIFDSSTETFPDDDEVNSYLSRQYRFPFIVPEVV